MNTANILERAKNGLLTNPSEGQIEKDVVIPLLELLGYSNIKSKLTIKTQAGRTVHTGTQADFVAYGNKENHLPTIVIDAKSVDEGISKADLPQVQSYAISQDIKPRAKFVMLSNGYATHIYPIDSEDPIFTSDLQSLFNRIDEIKNVLMGRSQSSVKVNQIDIDNFFKKAHDNMYSQDSIKPTPALIIMSKLMFIKMWEEQGRSLFSLSDILKKRKDYFDFPKTNFDSLVKKCSDIIFLKLFFLWVPTLTILGYDMPLSFPWIEFSPIS